MDDETLLKTMKNGLMIAGHEMGPVGDHWPALNAISAGLEDEFEEMERDRAVIGEMEFHFAEIIREVEEIAGKLSPEGKAILLEAAKELWDDYYAALEPIAPSNEPDADDIIEDGRCKNMKAATHILK